MGDIGFDWGIQKNCRMGGGVLPHAPLPYYGKPCRDMQKIFRITK